MNRHYVHLSMNEDTASQIGKCNTTLKKEEVIITIYAIEASL